MLNKEKNKEKGTKKSRKGEQAKKGANIA